MMVKIYFLYIDNRTFNFNSRNTYFYGSNIHLFNRKKSLSRIYLNNYFFDKIIKNYNKYKKYLIYN